MSSIDNILSNLSSYELPLKYKLRIKIKDFIYQLFRPYYKTKHFIQRGRHGWSDDDVWKANTYLAGIIADILEWYASDKSTGVSMIFAEPDDRWMENPGALDKAVERRNAEYLKYAAIFREYSHEGDAPDQAWKDKYGGVLDKDMQEALQWFSKTYLELWD